MVVELYKMHFKEINIKNRVYNYYFDNLFKAKKLETKNILNDKKSCKIWLFILLDIIMENQ